MSAYPIVLEGTTIHALVAGGGRVATRKVRALLDAGASVHVVAPAVSATLESFVSTDAMLRITRDRFAPAHLDDATLVVAATDDADVNADIARLARARGIPVNVADAPERGTFITPAVHRAGDVVVSVTAGGVPAAAVKIRDAIAATIDERYASAVHELGELRAALLAQGKRERWHEASAAVIDRDFRDRVEAGTLAAELDRWR